MGAEEEGASRAVAFGGRSVGTSSGAENRRTVVGSGAGAGAGDDDEFPRGRVWRLEPKAEPWEAWSRWRTSRRDPARLEDPRRAPLRLDPRAEPPTGAERSRVNKIGSAASSVISISCSSLSLSLADSNLANEKLSRAL